jgi:aminoglycoside phosphotransferase (APT) family kinase protein
VDWLRARSAIVADETGTLAICHNDFHPLNTLVDADGHATVLDWADAKLGDSHCDVARSLVIFSIAPLAASSTVERVALRASKDGSRAATAAYEQACTRSTPLACSTGWHSTLFGCGQVASLPQAASTARPAGQHRPRLP